MSQYFPQWTQPPTSPPPPKRRPWLLISTLMVSSLLVVVIVVALLVFVLYRNTVEQSVLAILPSCTIGYTGSAATITIQGLTANKDCDDAVAGRPGLFCSNPGGCPANRFYHYTGTPTNPEVCETDYHGRHIIVRDEGVLKIVGNQFCQSLMSPQSTPTPQQRATTGLHITKIETGTGFDQNTGAVTGPTDTFHNGDTAHIVFTVSNADQGAVLIVKLYLNGSLESTSPPHPIDSGTNVYDYFVVVHNTGEHKAEIDYNGSAEASITFNVV